MNDSLLSSLSSLPPHLKLSILNQLHNNNATNADAKAKNEPANPSTSTPSASTDSSSSTSFVDAVTSLAPLDPLPPCPFQLPATADNTLSFPPEAFLTLEMLHAIEVHGFIICDGFTQFARSSNETSSGNPQQQSDLVTAALAEAERMYEGKEMKDAGMAAAASATDAKNSSSSQSSSGSSASSSSSSSSSANWRVTALRGDHHRWLHNGSAEEAKLYPSLHRLMRQIDSIRQELNTLFAGSSSSNGSWRSSDSSEVQIASYQGAGARYVPHRDAVYNATTGFAKRRITSIVYLSQWERREQGGELRVFLSPRRLSKLKSSEQEVPESDTLPYFRVDTNNNKLTRATIPAASISPSSSRLPTGESQYLDVAPMTDRLVLFDSALVLHEVRPSFDLKRYALTVWMH